MPAWVLCIAELFFIVREQAGNGGKRRDEMEFSPAEIPRNSTDLCRIDLQCSVIRRW
jgi:hypothetical protein